MRPLLWAGLALALMLAGTLWWLASARGTRAEVPQRPLDVSAIDEGAEPVLAAPDASAESAVPASDAAHEADTSATSREVLDTAARPIRVRLIDAHCDRPIESGVALELSSRANGVKERVEPGPDGTFASEHAFPPARVVLRILEARSGEELLRHARVLDPREPVWTVRAEIGLVVPLELSIPAGIPGDRVMARVVEYGPDEPHDWILMPVLGGEHPFVRYFGLRQRVGSAAARIEVFVEPERGPGARGEAPLAMTHGLHAPVHVELVEETHAFGRVVDARGKGVVGARVTLLPEMRATPLEAREWDERSVLAGKDGVYAFEDLEPGLHVLHVSSGVRAAVPRSLNLRQGANDIGPTVFAEADGWTVQGRIVDWESWDGDFLVALVEPGTGQRRYTGTPGRDENRTSAFTFDNVPPGTYEVRPVPMYGIAFEPPSAIVSPSRPEVEFRSVRVAGGKLVLRVFEADGRAPIERFAVAYRGETGWTGRVMSEDESLQSEAARYVVWADGHRARAVDVEDFATTDGDVRVADVLLERGRSELVVFLDAEDDSAIMDGLLVPQLAAPLSGARVLADGREVATSDADGLAVVSLAEKPGDLAFELEGYHVLATERDDGLSFVWMIRTE